MGRERERELTRKACRKARAEEEEETKEEEESKEEEIYYCKEDHGREKYEYS